MRRFMALVVAFPFSSDRFVPNGRQDERRGATTTTQRALIQQPSWFGWSPSSIVGVSLSPRPCRLVRHRRRGGHTVRFILDKRRTVVVVVLVPAELSWKENIPVKQPVDVSGAASPGGGPRWTPARIWRKKLNPVHTLPGRYWWWLRPRGKWIEFECLAKQQPSNQPIGLQNMYYVAASQPRDLWFQRYAICIVFSFLWIRESNTMWATRDEARSRSYRPDYPRSPKASSRRCPPLLKDSSVILSDAFDNGRHGSCFLSFRIHTCILNTTWTGIVVFAMALFKL